MGGRESSFTIKEFPANERPREKLLSDGAKSLGNTELLAVIIGSGTHGENAIHLAGRLLAEFGGLRGILRASVQELCEVYGIGVAKAVNIKAALELGFRLRTEVPEYASIRGPADAAWILMEDMRYLETEHFKTILLDTKNHVLGTELVCKGSLNASIIHPREIFKNPIRKNCAAIILAHNHPSGDPRPSVEDKKVTERIVRAGKLLGIKVLDHVIIGDGKFYSFKQDQALSG